MKTTFLAFLIGLNIGLWTVVLAMEYTAPYKKLIQQNKTEICKDVTNG